MRRAKLLLFALALLLPTSAMFADGGGGDGSGNSGDGNSGAQPERRSTESLGSYPGGPIAKAPLSTGYYVTDNAGPPSGSPWAPTFQFVDTTGNATTSWRRILSGPNQRPLTSWDAPGNLGKEYFRNPNNWSVIPTPNGDQILTDSTNDAMAGPIPLGFPFYYYGRAYDSFYVSTNGIVALSNRRYQYDAVGNRIAYNPSREDPRPVHSGGALADTIPDDYGYKFSALNNSSSATAGILNPNNSSLPTTSLRAAMCPLWDDTELSTFDKTTNRPDEFGRAYWQRDPGGNIVRVYFVAMTMRGIKNVPIVNTTATVPTRALRADIQVVLDRSDSSITFNYRFNGAYQDPTVGIFVIPASAMYAANATIGIQSIDQEYTNYLYNVDFGGDVFVNGDRASTPSTSLAVQFKQWKNVVRVVNVTFQVPDRSNPSNFVSLPNNATATNFELLLGNQYLGVIRPVGIVQNVSDSLWNANTSEPGVNVTSQNYNLINNSPAATASQIGIRFQCIFRIRDVINLQAPPVYQKQKSTRALCAIRLENTSFRWWSRDTVIFDPYATNASLTKEMGRFKAEIIATDRGPNGEIYGDRWPFDDTTGIRIFGIATLQLPYINTFDDYDVSVEDGVIPSVKRFVSIGAQVVDGDATTYNPPPPRGAAGSLGLNSPVCLIDRRDIGGAPYNRNQIGIVGGDTLISFPLNLGAVSTRPVVIISYERAGKQVYPRGWSDAVRTGPEQAVYNTTKTTIQYQNPDRMLLEYAEPSPNGIDNITNIGNGGQGSWRDANFKPLASDVIKWPSNGVVAVTYAANSPRWGVFGGGGGSALDTNGRVIVNEFDAGKDFNFSRAVIPIPARWYQNTNTNKTFRFRIRGEMKNDGSPVGAPSDDNDAFYVDNIYVMEQDKPELEITYVSVDWPYTQAPASQARAIPMSAQLANNGSTAATAFGCAMYVQDKNTQYGTPFMSYYRYITVVALTAGQTIVQQFPTWNAQECGNGSPGNTTTPITTPYIITGEIGAGYDSYSGNDKTYTQFDLTLGPAFAYDDGQNDVGQFAGLSGKGLNLVAPNQDGNGAQPYGAAGGSSSGAFAMQFRILSRDTVTGFKAYFSGANQSPDYILYSIYKQAANANAGSPPQNEVTATRRYALRGQGVPDNIADTVNPYNFDQYVTFKLDTPYVVDPGYYFMTVAQLGQTGIEIGGDASRQGQVTTIRADVPAPGVGNYSIPAHPEMQTTRFWFETTKGSGSWYPMLTQVGNPGFPHLNWTGTEPSGLLSYSRGSWIPMIRPYFGPKASSICNILPVELSSFQVTPLSTALRLDWQTASEVNNHGFYVERRVKGNNVWNDVTFVSGNGTSSEAHTYAYTDENVVVGTTYQYRLRQEDRDGSINFSGIKEGRLNAATGSLGNALEQNTPNPMTNSTTINYTVADAGTVTLTINDVFGKVVRTYTVDANAGQNSIVWDGKDAQGTSVANGNYMYKLSGNGFTLSRKLTVVR